MNRQWLDTAFRWTVVGVSSAAIVVALCGVVFGMSHLLNGAAPGVTDRLVFVAVVLFVMQRFVGPAAAKRGFAKRTIDVLASITLALSALSYVHTGIPAPWGISPIYLYLGALIIGWSVGSTVEFLRARRAFAVSR